MRIGYIFLALTVGSAILGGCGDQSSQQTNPNITPAVCGNGVREGNEQCDDGNTDSGDSCSTTCQTVTVAACGNGRVETGEQCDDGNTNNGDSCSSTCQIPSGGPACGNGVLNVGEECDSGANNSNTAAGACRIDCRRARCGDSVVDPGEQCDDGNTTNSDSCSSTCQREPTDSGNIKVVSLIKHYTGTVTTPDWQQTINYDSNGRISTEVLQAGASSVTTTVTYSGSNIHLANSLSIQDYILDTQNRLSTIETKNPSGATQLLTKYEYDTNNRLAFYKLDNTNPFNASPADITFHVTAYDANNCIDTAQIAAVALGSTTTPIDYECEFETGRLSRITLGEDWNVSTFSYDSDGNLTRRENNWLDNGRTTDTTINEKFEYEYITISQPPPFIIDPIRDAKWGVDETLLYMLTIVGLL